MNKRIILGLALVSFVGLTACGGSDSNAEGTDTDSTIVSDTTNTEEFEEEVELAFDGVSKGDYMLYGYSEIEANGDEASVTDLTASLNETGGFEGEIAVTIDEVCQKAGCWITFNTSPDEAIRVFFRNHFTIPVETPSGTEAILYGIAEVDTFTVDFQKHLLDDAVESGETVSQEEYDAITEDLIETSFDCESILVKVVE